MKRIFTLDYLRGIAALCILIYHFFSLKGYEMDASMVIQRIGIYGVTVFYILSGLTLQYVYNNSLTITNVSLKKFFLKRAARILPLLWVVTICMVILKRKPYTNFDIFLNLTGLFGLLRWDTYLAMGAWSIGNELVFYLFFPIFLFLSKQNTKLFWLFSIIVFCISLYFSFTVIPNNFANWWSHYINPINQLIYFITGITLGKYVSLNLKINFKILLLVLVLSILVFCSFPVNGEMKNLVEGFARYIFWIVCTLIVGSLYLTQIKMPNFIHKPLLFLGEISYSLYLFHPIVYFSLGIISLKLGTTFSDPVYFIFMLVGTIVVSYISYEYFEKRIVKFINKKLG